MEAPVMPTYFGQIGSGDFAAWRPGEWADKWGVSRSTVDRWVRAGLPSFREGGARYIYGAEGYRWVMCHTRRIR